MRTLNTTIKFLLLLAAFTAFAGTNASAQVLSGSYVGNGVAARQIQVGFVPDFVMVKGDTVQIGAFRSSTMVGDASKPATGATALQANMIQSIDVANGGGFTVGSHASVNSNGVTYHWTAFNAVSGKMVVGTYAGNGVAGGQAISGIGLTPNLVFIMSAGAAYAIHKSSAHANANDFEFSTGDATLVSSLNATGFTLGNNDARVNAAATTYHYVAWQQVANEMKVGSYVGNAAAQNITGLGFEPEFVMIKAAATGQDATAKSASTGRSIDSSMFFRVLANATLRVTALITDGFSIGTTNTVSQSGQTYTYYAWKRTAEPYVVTGSYTPGNGTSQSITSLGFQPDVVIVKQESISLTGKIAFIKTSSMPSNNSKAMTGGTAFVTTAITSLDAGGFTVGSNTAVNENNATPRTYHFIAFKASPSTMKVGTYNGNGSATGPVITGLGFSPELVFIMSAGTGEAIHQSTASSGNAFSFTSTANTTGLLTLGTDGFSITSTNSRVNTSGTAYYYIAWNEIPGFMDVGTYTAAASATDNRNITGVGFEPEYAIVKETTNARDAVMKPASTGSSIDTNFFFAVGTATSAPNEIQALQVDGFQIGTDYQVQEPSQPYVYYAWKRTNTVAEFTAVRLTTSSATRYDNRVLVEWKTGYEVDNLGFHVYREVDGMKTRITRSLVGGSGLTTGQGAATRGEQHYAAWDLAAQSVDPRAVYWIEDFDFNGKSTLNGPVVPVDGRLQVAPEIASSSELRELGKRLKRRGKVFVAAGTRSEGPSKSTARAQRTSTGAVPLEIQTQRWLASQGAIKIGVTQSGWYRVAQPGLVAAGLDPQVDPQSLRLFVDGVEQAIAVTGSADGRFDASDAIEFYGNGADTPYTETRTYWLVAGGRGGQRIAVRPAPGKSGEMNAGASFPFTVQQKERSIYFAALRNGDDENWFGAFISEEPTDLSLNVSNILPGAAAAIDVTLQGVTSSAVDPDHHVGVLVNGREVGELIFDGQSKSAQTFTVPAGVLVDGANTVTIVSRGSDADYSLVDVVRVHYPHLYRADGEVLRFTAEGPGDVTVSGFASGSVRVIDVTNTSAPEEVRANMRSQNGLLAATIRVPNQGSRTLLAFTDATIATPAFVRGNTPSQLSAVANGADYLAVTHNTFADAVAPLLARRVQRGLSVAQVDIEDVYDEFSFGEKTPQALKDFVTYARTQWRKAPAFLLLVGDATLDPRDYASFGDADFVPTKQIPMAQIALETASDDWFADSDNDGMPELAIGRLPVRTVEQAQIVVGKMLAYEDADSTGWGHRILLVADQNSDGSDFEASVNALGRTVPSGYDVQRVLAGFGGAALAQSQLQLAVNYGQLIVNYVGHGSVRIWGTEGTILTSEDVAATWENGAQLPFVVAMNCLNGFFHGVYDEESLAETLLRRADGGAVAVWASSGLTDSATQALVNQELFRLLFADSTVTMGQAAALAKRAITSPDVRRSWIFFGDPALRLKNGR
jgi:hypothetical protein